MSDDELEAFRAFLETRKSELDGEQAHLLENLSTMEPTLARRALLRLADDVAALRRDYEILRDKETHGSPG